jgi:ATP-binding cassette subfamily B protein
LGLYPITDGDILFDGISIKEIDPNQLRKHVTATFQDYENYHLTLRENIGIGNLALLNDDDRIWGAAQKGGAIDVVTALQKGLESELGYAFNGGHELSHGQWQKVAISRSFLRDADIIVLDEPTASLDPLAEAEVFERLMALAEGKTAIFISHRLGSCLMADRIFVLKNGMLLEQGSHQELLRFGGEYARMFESQAQWYIPSEIY